MNVPSVITAGLGDIRGLKLHSAGRKAPPSGMGVDWLMKYQS